MLEKTLVILKPCTLQRGLIGEITHRFERKGLRLAGMKMMQLTDELLSEHYAHEKKRLEYEARQKAIRDRDILIKTGENRGRKEIILSMIEAGLPLEQIAEITKETLETIQELKKKMG